MGLVGLLGEEYTARKKNGFFLPTKTTFPTRPLFTQFGRITQTIGGVKHIYFQSARHPGTAHSEKKNKKGIRAVQPLLKQVLPCT